MEYGFTSFRESPRSVSTWNPVVTFACIRGNPAGKKSSCNCGCSQSRRFKAAVLHAAAPAVVTHGGRSRLRVTLHVKVCRSKIEGGRGGRFGRELIGALPVPPWQLPPSCGRQRVGVAVSLQTARPEAGRCSSLLPGSAGSALPAGRTPPPPLPFPPPPPPQLHNAG